MKKFLFFSLLFSLCLVMSVSCKHGKNKDDNPSVNNNQNQQVATTPEETWNKAPELTPVAQTEVVKVQEKLAQSTNETAKEVAETIQVDNSSSNQSDVVFEAGSLTGTYYTVIQDTNSGRRYFFYNISTGVLSDPYLWISNFSKVGGRHICVAQLSNGTYTVLDQELKSLIDENLYTRIGSFSKNPDLNNRMVAYVTVKDTGLNSYIDTDLHPLPYVVIYPSQGAYGADYFVVNSANCTLQKTSFSYADNNCHNTFTDYKYLYEVEFSTLSGVAEGSETKNISLDSGYTCTKFLQLVNNAKDPVFATVKLNTRSGTGLNSNKNDTCNIHL